MLRRLRFLLTASALVLTSCGSGGTTAPGPESTVRFTFDGQPVELPATAVVMGMRTLIAAQQTDRSGNRRELQLSHPGTMTGTFTLRHGAAFTFTDGAGTWLATPSDSASGAALELAVGENGAMVSGGFEATVVALDSAGAVVTRRIYGGSFDIYYADIVRY